MKVNLFWLEKHIDSLLEKNDYYKKNMGGK